ncbi:hypothetical protein [Bradyrhizobium iriomotense]|uniref:Uncharacterized protein n=1 Tax=Bradyrhizobium iriomotense TaxID=441950 RepID=A0ABQ6B9E8_9BRAD|nr:hypothetical protein [Bradyrhizobium iriomotense]GLR89286.1 hypothetical protein GCM10007857_59990 [Bradyrhizobium iriomotense]
MLAETLEPLQFAALKRVLHARFVLAALRALGAIMIKPHLAIATAAIVVLTRSLACTLLFGPRIGAARRWIWTSISRRQLLALR